MDIPLNSKRALCLLINGMCRSCTQTKYCSDCLYLEEAFNGETISIVKYIALQSRITRKLQAVKA